MDEGNILIDNTPDNQLIDKVNELLEISEFSGMAVGFFYLSGFEAIQKNLQSVKNLRLIIGSRTNKATVEEMTKGHLQRSLMQDELRRQKRPRRDELAKMKASTASEYGDDLQYMEQTTENEQGLKALWQLIQEKRINIRIYTKGTLHSKAYLFTIPNQRHSKGEAIVGSSNLSISGLRNNSELNISIYHGKDYKEIEAWFEKLWKESQDYNEAFLETMQESWFKKEVTPYEIYIKTLYNLVRERIDIPEKTLLTGFDTENLYPFQKDAYNRALDLLESTTKPHHGIFISDVVGLGKSYIAIALMSYYWSVHQKGTLIVCPASLRQMWEDYKEKYHLRCKIISSSELRLDENEKNPYTENPEYQGYGVVVIDESHHFRNDDIQRYQVIEPFLQGKKVILLTATPQNNSVWDVYHQIKLFHPSDVTDLNISPNHLKEYFKKYEENEEKITELLQQFLIRRTRNDIKKNPKYAEWVKEHRFPKRKLHTLNYNIESIYQATSRPIYEELIAKLFPLDEVIETGSAQELEGRFQYSIYNLTKYIKPKLRRERQYVGLSNLGKLVRGLLKTLLFKRLESSVYSFYKSIERMLKRHESILTMLESDSIRTGDARTLQLYLESDDQATRLKYEVRLQAYPTTDFQKEKLKKAIEADKAILGEVLDLVEPLYKNPKRDAKLKCLIKNVVSKHPKEKILIFSEFTDTVDYVHRELKKHCPNSVEIKKISSANSRQEKVDIVRRFSPTSQNYTITHGSEIQYLITSDVLSEGQNLQDAYLLVNYDFHWNPVRLIQRIGRVDRIGSTTEQIEIYNFLPDTNIEQELGLQERVQRRINQITKIYGIDGKVLSEHEDLNENSLFAIYSAQDERVLDGEDNMNTVFDKAEQTLEALKAKQPKEYQRIINLKDGIRCMTSGNQKGIFVFLQSGNLQKLYFHDGEKMTDNVAEVLELIEANPKMPKAKKLKPEIYNKRLKVVYEQFKQVLLERKEEKESARIDNIQVHFRKRLQEVYGLFSNANDRKRADELSQILSREIPRYAITALKSLKKRLGKENTNLIHELSTIITTNRVRDFQNNTLESEQMIIRTICSELIDE